MEDETSGRRAARETGLGVRVSLGTYRLFFEAGQEDWLVRVREEEEERVLRRRAGAREEERARCVLLR